jgi:hypothetical protein
VAFSDPETWQQRALLRGVDEILDLLEPIEQYLLPFRAVFSPHDNPNLLSDYNVKRVTLEAAAARKCLTQRLFVNTKHIHPTPHPADVDVNTLPPTKHLGFASAGVPSSPVRPVEFPINQSYRPAPRTNKTFIHDNRLSMDLCQHL